VQGDLIDRDGSVFDQEPRPALAPPRDPFRRSLRHLKLETFRRSVSHLRLKTSNRIAHPPHLPRPRISSAPLYPILIKRPLSIRLEWRVEGVGHWVQG